MPSVLSAPQTAPLQHQPGEIFSLTRLQEIQGQLRDIHPGPPLESASDPRLLAWGWLLIAVLAALLIGTTINTLWRQRRWAHQIDWQAADLVPSLQAALREAAIARWPEARALQGNEWLAWLDRRGGCHFGARQWPDWLYGSDTPDKAQRARLRLAYLSWGRRCVSAPHW
ncbi:DUF4381 family protein, partial [Aeromonas media]|uniref:DUF4381 family protein n=1 Tax=Aeromonas media TaxID=651 RepID=UPI0005B1E403